MADSKDTNEEARGEKTKKLQNAADDNSSISNGIDENAKEISFGQIGQGVATGAITINRDEYLQAYRDMMYEHNQLQLKNNLLHRRLAEYYKKRKLDHVLKPLENAPHLEDKYQQKLFAYQELKEKEEIEMADVKSKLNVVQVQYIDKLEHVEKSFDTLQTYERTTGTGLIYSKKGKPIADKTVERFLTLQKRKSEQSSALCLRYIRARNAVNELEIIVHKLEMIAPGLNVAQFEQLYIDKQNYLSKIEEREDELIKNRVNCTEHNQMLAHIREKMHHTDEVIDFTECDLGDAEIELIRARGHLGEVKGRRDKLRWSLEGERTKAGLLTRKDLLRDYQDATDEVIKLREKKKLYEKEIAEITKKLRETRKCMQVHNAADTNSEDDYQDYKDII